MSNEKTFKLNGKYIVSAEIELVTGLHIGTSKEEVEVGGLDNPVVKDPLGRPYIPGSSLKGKMRMLMEFHKGLVDRNGKVHSCQNEECTICGLFGRAIEKANESQGSAVFNRTRLIVRDAKLDEDSLKNFESLLETKWTEIKYENSINRITSAANPRPLERVPAGARFKAEFVVNVFKGDEDGDKKYRYLEELLTAMELLEDDYLGGSGTRGYGKIKFKTITIEYRDAAYYTGGEEPIRLLIQGDSPREVREKLKDQK
ncbi:MAG: CRISPR-associated RAMP protein, Csm3 family [Thermotoga sp. 50_1627]|uniref:type III-A CRISPR-associated RAMP protein Csm3 n=1 Tax=Pseudothermotoga sp. TaxID=2033661 RepID=UPI00076D8E13|nr:MAG: CRISPR-associated RAMP protein, Csm3 family [Thermotoga sp. 50_64]KUK25291.1 MAG: CRISPR-associated RAMP protein, Csm3 family [Thermotoga sp. 50_1627]MBC7116974.1 type III-A CRISPR-associated RAMP protein Csm3 [Pseudothermotoga sp.]MDK2923004.1 CRISPR-associated protein Csm3 [Pseudothermotoga sp.]HBT39925.1 type III-A CRISPR-associated RAMP protein Csm3 [Pseudothermotoga sp.]